MTIKSRERAAESDRLEIASDWLLRIQDGALDSEELAQWLQWYDADPAHRAAFEKVQATLESIQGLPQSERLAWASRLDDPDQSKRPRHRFRDEIWSISRLLASPRPAWAAGFTLALAFIAGIGIWKFAGDRSIEMSAFKTERATHRDISLPDGSHIRLGARSQLSVNFTSETRYLVLEGGEAFFDVAKDPDRPFLVQAGDVTIRAVGTQFNVRRVIDQTIVAVTEGSVDVLQSLSPNDRRPRHATTPTPNEAIRLVAGEQVSIGPAGDVASVKQIEPNAVNSWQEGRLEFADEPLGMVIDTINRYSDREVVVTDKAVNDLRFTGTVSREHIDEWLFALAEVFPVDVRRVDETVLISQRSTPSRQNFRFAPDVR